MAEPTKTEQAPEIMLLRETPASESDSTLQAQIRLRYLQDHDKLGGSKVSVTGVSNKEGDAALALVAQQGDVGFWGQNKSNMTWGILSDGTSDALTTRFMESYNRQHKTDLNPENNKDVLQATNSAYNEQIKNEMGTGKIVSAPLLRDDSTLWLAATSNNPNTLIGALSSDNSNKNLKTQIMLNYLQEQGNLGGEKVPVTGISNDQGNAALKEVTAENLVYRFMRVYNEKNDTHLNANDSDHVFKAQEAVFRAHLQKQNPPAPPAKEEPVTAAPMAKHEKPSLADILAKAHAAGIGNSDDETPRAPARVVAPSAPVAQKQ